MTKSLLRMTVSGGGAGTGVKELALARLNKLAMAIEEVAVDEQISLAALRELADDNNEDIANYMAAVALCTELRWDNQVPNVARVCVGNCQKFGSIAMLGKVVDAVANDSALAATTTVNAHACLKQCEQAPACEIASSAGNLMLAPSTSDAIVDALRELNS
jgi:hypothetical protein